MQFCFQKYLCYIFHRARTFLTNITFEMYNNHNIILEGPSVSVMTIVQCLSVSVTAPKRRQRGGLGTPGHLRPTTWGPLKPVTSGGRRTSSAGFTLSEKYILQIHFGPSTGGLPLKLAQLCFSAPPPLPQFHLFHLSKRFSCDRVIGGFVRNLMVAAASLCPTLIEIRGDPIREASAGWKKVDF